MIRWWQNRKDRKAAEERRREQQHISKGENAAIQRGVFKIRQRQIQDGFNPATFCGYCGVSHNVPPFPPRCEEAKRDFWDWCSEQNTSLSGYV